MTPISRRAWGPTARAIREAQDRPLVDVAAAAGLSKGFYSNFESGHRRPTAEPTAAIARVLRVDVAVLTGQLPAIETLRAALGITVADLARAVDITPAYLMRIERGTDTPDPELLVRVAKRLGVHVAALRPEQAPAGADSPRSA